jgi:hypothetical protein
MNDMEENEEESEEAPAHLEKQPSNIKGGFALLFGSCFDTAVRYPAQESCS